MSENKFIAQLKGNTAPGSVLEIQDKGSKTSFANMPSGTSDAIVTYSDKRNNATAVLKGAMNWKINGSTLSVANPAGDGSDYTGQTDVSGISDQQGNNLWINASYTVPADGLFLTKNTKWVLKLCGDNLIVNGSDTAEFTVLITAGNSTNITKKFFVGEQANQFCKELVIDFAESNTSTVKLEQGDTITLKLLSDIPNASARIYQGMTTLTLLQRAVDAENVISKTGSYEEVVDDINYLEDHIIVKSATMPTASADLVGEVYQYMGATAYPYEHGYVYECVQTSPGVYAWQRLDVQPGGSRGRFLSLWNCATGLAMTNPPISPYEYNVGDYFIVSNVSSGTNYKPSGTQYVIGTASTAVETEDVFVDDTYFFDGTNWKLQNTSNDIKDLVDTKVSKDGSSIMTGPLKFRAGSFVGAIAGGLGDGISFYKLKSDNTIDSEVASLTKTNGFTPGNTNTMNIGSSSLKWKDAHIGRVITSVLNNGANINVPTTSGTLALKSDIGIGINNVTNCITEIPQDINLELSSGTLTLKAGSKVYMPNGAGVFDVVTIANDISNSGNAMKSFAITDGSSLLWTNYVSSGGTAPENPHIGQIWYDTTNNLVKRYSAGSGTWVSGFSLPVALLNPNATSATTVTETQVFNGFGYIGSTVFALPGVKGLIPNGRNADGTLKNTLLTKQSVNVFTPSSATFSQITNIALGGTLSYHTFTYDEVNNKNSAPSYMNAGDVTWTNGKITSFNPKTSFHAVDYNDYKKTADQVNIKQDEATALNYDNISNCITEIPQDIKLTLSNGTLTLKAGSKVYIPNGTGVFNTVTIPNDKTFKATGSSTTNIFIVYYPGDGTIKAFLPQNIESGTSYSVTDGIWYDTTNNSIKRINGGSVAYSGLSFPVCVLQITSGTITSIDQVFNGCGFIGSSVFALPGLKALAPNGRNEDGTLKNVNCSLQSVTVINNLGDSKGFTISLTQNGGLTSYYYHEYAQEEYPGSGYIRWYKPSENKAYNTQTGQGSEVQSVSATLFYFNASTYTFKPKTAFHAVDYNDAAIKEGDNKFTGSNEFVNTIKAPSVYGYGSDGVRTASIEFIDNGNDNEARLVAVSNNGNNAATAGLHFNNGVPYFAVPTSDAVGAAIATAAKNKATDGYFKLSNGLIIQWGVVTTTGATRAVTLPTAFTTTNYCVCINPTDSSSNQVYTINVNSKTTTGFTSFCGGNVELWPFNWIAIGY